MSNNRLYVRRLVVFLMVIMYQANSNAQQMGALTSEIILEKPDSNQDFPIVSLQHKATAISFSNSDYKGVIRAINDLQSDIEKVTGIEPVHYKDGMFYITGPTWTKQQVEYQEE